MFIMLTGSTPFMLSSMESLFSQIKYANFGNYLLKGK